MQNLILNENAYFLRKRTDSYLSNAFIEELFKKASVEKEGRYLLKEINKVESKPFNYTGRTLENSE